MMPAYTYYLGTRDTVHSVGAHFTRYSTRALQNHNRTYYACTGYNLTLLALQESAKVYVMIQIDPFHITCAFSGTHTYVHQVCPQSRIRVCDAGRCTRDLDRRIVRRHPI